MPRSTYLLTLALIALFSCSTEKKSSSKFENPTIRPLTSEQRKEHTEKKLKELDIPVNNWLPLIEDINEARFRSSKEIATRCVVLFHVIDVAYGSDRTKIISWLKENELWDSVSPSEKAYLENSAPTEEANIEFSWRVENLFTLLWSLGHVQKLGWPIELVDFDKPELRKVLINIKENHLDFIKSSELRDKEEILDEVDMIYRVHWAVRDAGLKDETLNVNFHSGIVYERHYALNWLTFYAEDWDDITTDT